MIVHFKGRTNGNGRPSSSDEFRSLKDHANPNKGVRKIATRAKKEVMTRDILATRAARKSLGQARQNI